MVSRVVLGVSLLLVLIAPSQIVAGTGNDVDRLMASSVCVLGDLHGGRFEASGFVVPPGDRVLTTAHGIAGARNLRVKLNDGRVFAARLDRIGNERADLALLTVVGARFDPVELGSVEQLRPGDPVRTVGCPSGFDFTLTQGVVSSIRPSELGYPLIQTDVPVNPGSSGGALFDAGGRVVGIIKGGAVDRERIYFALPIDLGRALLAQVDDERLALDLFNRAVLEPNAAEKIRLYRKVVELEPTLIEGHFNLAVALERAGHRDQAEAAYRETLRLRPDYRPAILNLGANLHEQERYLEAVEIYRGALADDPTAVRLRNNLAQAYQAMGRSDEARRELETILRQSPDYAPAHYGLGILLDRSFHDRKQAAVHYRRYLALAPGASDARTVRGWLDRLEEDGTR